MIDQISNEMMIASQIMHTNNVSEIVSELGYQPLLIVNALFAGEAADKFTYVKKKDIIKIHEDVEIDALAVTDGLADTREQLELFITNQNSLETDMTLEELHMFLPSVPEMHIKMAAHTSTKLATYEYADPKDKESVYTFVTLAENLDKRWGTKQFDQAESKATKHAKRNK